MGFCRATLVSINCVSGSDLQGIYKEAIMVMSANIDGRGAALSINSKTKNLSCK
ncbi:MAG: hypothetical protein LBD43_02000 [Holosporales bacterium]|nr:hypothetical protein [Holosporales bacterium]